MWRYTGYLLGIAEEFLPKTYAEGLAVRSTKSFLSRRAPDESSKILVHSTIKALDDDIAVPFSTPMFHVTMWHFFGEEVCSKLEIPKATFRRLIAWQLFGFWFADCRRVDYWFPPAKIWKNYWFHKYIDVAL